MDIQIKLENRKKCHQILVPIAITIICIFMSIILTGCFGDVQKSNLKKAKERIFDITNIEISNEAKTIYSYYDDTFVSLTKCKIFFKTP